MVERYISSATGVMVKATEGEWTGSKRYVRYEDVLAALQTLIDQLATNHEWRNGAVLAYNAISCSEFDTGEKHD